MCFEPIGTECNREQPDTRTFPLTFLKRVQVEKRENGLLQLFRINPHAAPRRSLATSLVQDWHAGGTRVANTLDRNGLYPIRQAASPHLRETAAGFFQTDS